MHKENWRINEERFAKLQQKSEFRKALCINVSLSTRLGFMAFHSPVINVEADGGDEGGREEGMAGQANPAEQPHPPPPPSPTPSPPPPPPFSFSFLCIN